MTTRPKVIVIHVGAPFNYAIPAVLERGGMLEAFYTDMCAGRGLGRLARFGTWLPLIGRRLRLLSNRQPPPAVLAKTRTFDISAMAGALLESFAKTPDQVGRARHFSWACAAKMMRLRPLGDATHILSVYGQGNDFLGFARSKGLRVVADVNIAPSFPNIVMDEQAAWPEWEPPLLGVSEPGFLKAQFSEIDLFICPSEFVRDELVGKFAISKQKTCIVPYPVETKFSDIPRNPVKGRILFIGSVGLRKGAHYLAMSAQLLKTRGRHYDFRCAGNVSQMFMARPECSELKFLGRVPRTKIHEEYSSADIFVLPSLAEGSAGVVFEALAAGVPVVTTRESGSMVRDGVDGFIVPSRDPTSLANAIEKLVEDRLLQQEMSENARRRALDFSWDCYQKRLMEVICST